MHTVPGVVCAGLGAVLGTPLAALTRTVPADGPTWTPAVLRGEQASPRRRGVLALLAAVVLGLIGAGIGWHAALPAFLFFGAAGTALAVIDVDCHRLPDALTYPTYVAGVVLLGVAAALDRDGDAYVHALVGMAAVFAVFFVLAFVGGIGFGDTKLAGVIGLYLGWLGYGPLLFGLVAGFAVGALVAVAMLLARVAGWRTDIAFGPSLLAGALVAVVIGRHVVRAYLTGG